MTVHAAILLSVLIGRIALFHAPGFPTADAPAISDAVLDRAFRGLPVDRIDDLRGQLAGERLLVLPYGSAFPADAWPGIRNFVERGGSLVVLGGAPFHQPVWRDPDGQWRLGARTPFFAHQLLIGPAEAVNADGLKVALPDSSWSLPVDGAHTVWELTLRFGTRPDTPNEEGAQSKREAVARPLVHLVDGQGIPRACPLLEIDRLLGTEAGGRWIFAASDAPPSAPLIRAIVLRAMEPAHEFRAIPLYASVEPGEAPRIRIEGQTGAATLIVRDDRGNVFERTRGEGTVTLRPPPAPGLYRVEVTTASDRTTTGFWVRDDALLSSGPHMTVSRDWMRRNGRVFPIIGTTYMASDVDRHFLFEPNPDVWDRDFARMQRLGINFVRTGIWTGWSRIDEAALRAIDAYVQTAAKHDIVVSFTFFAFLPPSFGGSNPYLDPRSIAGESNFVDAIARRFRGCGWIQYDLINEPSYAPADELWTNTPIGDPWERAAAPADATPFAFNLFTQNVLDRWAAQLRNVVRNAGGDPLVTLGQDEGGMALRSSQQLHADSVDYTSMHPWWNNDDVLASGVFAKVPEKPMLFQETGMMRLEDARGWPWRTPGAAAKLLERKFACAFAARGAGAVEWAWNINPYMPVDNEAVIGLFRPDGTAKPELDVLPRFAAFFREAAPWLDDFAPDPVIVVIPQSRILMNRPHAIDGFRRIIRVLAERFGVVPTALSDLRLTAQRLRNARLIIVPSAEFLDAQADRALLAASEAGAKVLYTGSIHGEGRPVRFHEMSRGGWATFDRDLRESLLRSDAPRTEWHEPLPLEFAREDGPLVHLLCRALAAAGVRTFPSDDHVAVRLLTAPRAVLAVAINETSEDAQRPVTVAGHSVKIAVPAGGARLVLFERATGRVIAGRKGVAR